MNHDGYFTAPDADNEPSLWLPVQGREPTQIMRRCDLPSEARHLWDTFTAAVTA